jgi:hypothetical protein
MLHQYLVGTTTSDWKMLPAIYNSLSSISVPMMEPSKKKENDMYLDEEIAISTPIQQERNYLLSRLSDEKYLKSQNARITYGLAEDPPEEAEDYVERIKSGKYVIESRKNWDGNEHTYLVWRDPELKKDPQGYNKYREELIKQEKETMDIIQTSTAADGLKALKEFQALN